MLLSNLSHNAARYYRIFFHIVILALILVVPLLLRPEKPPTPFAKFPLDDGFLGRWTIVGVVTTLLYFVNVYFLIPRFLQLGLYYKYLLSLFIGFVAMICVKNVLMEMFTTPMPSVLQNGRQTLILFPGRMDFLPMLMSCALGISFEMIVNSEIQRKEKAQIEREKMSSELSFLKSQINPHFLFNSLNSIYALAEQQSHKTGEAIILLSNLMRYMLYGSNNGRIEIGKEIECIENFIKLQKMRISTREDILIEVSIEGRDSKILVEPLILMPFVENAFKHGVSYHQRSEVRIRLVTNAQQLFLHVVNTKKIVSQAESGSRSSESGIGLANIKRRLDLLYPKKHALKIVDDRDFFDVSLSIAV